MQSRAYAASFFPGITTLTMAGDRPIARRTGLGVTTGRGPTTARSVPDPGEIHTAIELCQQREDRKGGDCHPADLQNGVLQCHGPKEARTDEDDQQGSDRRREVDDDPGPPPESVSQPVLLRPAAWTGAGASHP